MGNVLIVEDDLVIADMVELALVNAGYNVCGIAGTVAEAVSLGDQHEPDITIIDVRLAHGGLGTDIPKVSDAVGRSGILYATGNTSAVMTATPGGHACISKPYSFPDLLRSVELVAEMKATGTASRPYPRGFQILPQATDLVSERRREATNDAKEVQKLLRQQAAIARFGSFALRENDLLKILTEAARVCAEGLSVPFSKICRFRSETNDLLIEAGCGWKPGVVGNVVSRADKTSPQGHAFSTGQPSICNDLRKSNDFKLPAFYADHGIISTIDVLIKGNGHPYGVLEVDSAVQNDYDQNDVNFLTGFANVLAEAVATSERTAQLQTAIEQMQHLVQDKDRLLDQKKILAEEFHHRVRNNLQLVYGMLTQQLQDPDGGEGGIAGIARRVFTLAQVYEHLGGADLTRTTDFGNYVRSLCSNLADIHSVANGNVVLECESDPLNLKLDVVTALGIVITELVTNSFDHAFPEGNGTTSVSVRVPDIGDTAIIVVRDNGIGFSIDRPSKRHGLGLVRRLIEQVGATMSVNTDQGTAWTIALPFAREVETECSSVIAA